jgi:hypothetical protein
MGNYHNDSKFDNYNPYLLKIPELKTHIPKFNFLFILIIGFSVAKILEILKNP